MGKKKNTGFPREKIFALADKYGLNCEEIEGCYYFFLPKLGLLDDENDTDYRDDLFDWSENSKTILVYTSYLVRAGVGNGWSAQFEHSEEVGTLERLEAIVSYMVEMANGMKELNKKVLELNMINDISKDF
jgi:hypothetical protein